MLSSHPDTHHTVPSLIPHFTSVKLEVMGISGGCAASGNLSHLSADRAADSSGSA